MVEVIDDAVEAEVDGTDPNLKIDVAVKKSADAEIEKFYSRQSLPFQKRW